MEKINQLETYIKELEYLQYNGQDFHNISKISDELETFASRYQLIKFKKNIESIKSDFRAKITGNPEHDKVTFNELRDALIHYTKHFIGSHG